MSRLLLLALVVLAVALSAFYLQTGRGLPAGPFVIDVAALVFAAHVGRKEWRLRARQNGVTAPPVTTEREMPPGAVAPTSAEEIPDWAPAMWMRGRVNRWFWRSPGRMVVWFCASPLVGLAMTFLLALSGGWTWLVLAAATALLARQSIVYGPRAWHAFRR